MGLDKSLLNGLPRRVDQILGREPVGDRVSTTALPGVLPGAFVRAVVADYSRGVLDQRERLDQRRGRRQAGVVLLTAVIRERGQNPC